ASSTALTCFAGRGLSSTRLPLAIEVRTRLKPAASTMADGSVTGSLPVPPALTARNKATKAVMARLWHGRPGRAAPGQTHAVYRRDRGSSFRAVRCRENGGSPPIRLHADVMTRVWRYGSIAGGCRGRPMARWRGQFMGVEMAVTVVVPGLETPRQSRAEPGTGNWRGSPARQLVGAQGLIAIAIHRI